MADLLTMRGIGKRFGGVQALEGVDFTLQKGEVHAIVGENGAGKSTLIKILSGAHQPNSGKIVLNGEEVTLSEPRQAQDLGVATIYQEGSLYPDLSVLENLFIGHQIKKRFGLLDWQEMARKAEEVFGDLAIDLDLKARAGDLSRAQTKLAEIARALLRQARVIIMDEPTAALPSDDAERLFKLVKDLRSQGVAVIYISHRLEEIFEIADTVTVLRDGEKVGHSSVKEVDQDWLIQKMVGRELKDLYPRNRREAGAALLEVNSLTRTGVFEDISFQIREGEVVGMAGLVGSGRSEVARAVFGIDPYDEGSVTLDGEPLPHKPKEVIAKGVALLPEDRSAQGLVLPFSVKNNVALPVLRSLHKNGILDEPRERKLANEFIEGLSIRTPSAYTPAASLSGGNQQKVVLGKWLASEPRVFILDEPTQGVDVGAKREIHRQVDELVQRGVGILLISSDLPEVLGMADRILVMREGHIVAELPQGVGPEEVMRHATGLSSEESSQSGSEPDAQQNEEENDKEASHVH